MTVVFSYGGGRQTVAMCVLIKRGILAKPDVTVIADTGRENPMTWEYLDKHVRPMLGEVGVTVEVASHKYATVDIYAHNGDLLLPMYTDTGKIPGFCSNEWKKRVVGRYLRDKHSISSGTKWLGLALDEKRRWRKLHNTKDGGWDVTCPLVDLMLNTYACLELIKSEGLPEPHHSSCWMCPHKSNAEWKVIKEQHPQEWKQAVELDVELRENDDRGGVWLHHSRKPLAEADLDVKETKEIVRQCSLGMCFI